MEQPRRTRPSRNARSAPNTLSLTSPPYTLNDDIPQVLERSKSRLADVKQLAKDITGAGILVKLFPVGDSNRTLWIVGSPHANKWTPSKLEDTCATNANAKANASHPAKAGPASTHKAKAQLISERAVRQKGQRSRARGGGQVTEQQIQEGQGESEDVSNTQEEEEEEEEEGGGEDTGEENEEEQTAGDEESNEEDEVVAGGTKKHENATRATDEHHTTGNDCSRQAAEDRVSNNVGVGGSEAVDATGNAVDGDNVDDNGDDYEIEEEQVDGRIEEDKAGKRVSEKQNSSKDDQHEQDIDEQDGNEDNRKEKQAESEEADGIEDKSDERSQDRNEDMAEEEERDRGKEAEGGREGEGGREVEGEGAEVSDMAQEHVISRDNALTDRNGGEEENEDDKSGGEKSEDRVSVREDKETELQGVAANSYKEAFESWQLRSMDDEEGEASGDFGEKEILSRKREVTPDGGRKRSIETSESSECSTPNDRLSKRSKTDGSEGRHGKPTEDLPEQTGSPKTTPRLRASSPTLTTASPGSTIAIIRQTSVVPRLEDTESAVWHAAERDSVISSLPPEQQTKSVRTALSLGSEEGIEELRRFVSNARKRSEHMSESLVSDSNLITSRPRSTIGSIGNALVPQSDCLAYLSALYRSLDVLESKGTLFTIAKRANLAAMAWYRQNIVPKGVGGTRARDANLKNFRAIFPHHPSLERPEDNPATSRDWSRLRLWLMEGGTWLDVYRLFGGNGAFLALPPQCVPDSHVARLPAKHSSSLLGLLDVAWRALDDDARQTMNALVRLALAGQPLPGATLTLERSDVGTSVASAGLSPMLAGWSVPDYATEWHGNAVIAPSKGEEMNGSENSPEAVLATTTGTCMEEVVPNEKSSIWKETVSPVDDGLLENVDFDERLSQQI